jgi:hypothetical protein
MFLSFVVIKPMVDDVALFREVLVICSKGNILKIGFCVKKIFISYLYLGHFVIVQQRNLALTEYH